jgi:hypothetical protein
VENSQAERSSPAGLVLYWFPRSSDEIKPQACASLAVLSLYASQCVSMELADGSTPHSNELVGSSTLPVAVLAKPDGTAVNKVENTNGKLKVADVEKVVDTEMKQREGDLTAQMKEAAAKSLPGIKTARSRCTNLCSIRNACFLKKPKKRKSN